MRGATEYLRRWRRKNKNFNPRSPCGERLPLTVVKTSQRLFQSTLPVRGATFIAFISPAISRISIHAPRAGSDETIDEQLAEVWEFQSTLPVRGATCVSIHIILTRSDFNPRSPCGERRYSCSGDFAVSTISIHAPRAGSDVMCCNTIATTRKFQSTLPVRGATSRTHGRYAYSHISIHAPRAGSDCRIHKNAIR